MLMLQDREQVEALTFHEVRELLAEARREEQDRRNWLLAIAPLREGADPIALYNDLSEATAERMVDDEPNIENHPQKGWLRA